MKTQTDNLINDLRRQKPAALGRLFAEYGPTVFRMVQRIVPGREDAEEVYQDVFVKALRGIMTFDPKKATLSTWLCRIAYNESLNFVRRRKPNLVYMDDSKLGIAQIEELCSSSNTTTEWTQENGVNGRKITSKSNGNSIFLPAAGYRDDTSLYGAGSYGLYWSRSLNTSRPPGEYYLCFGSGYFDWHFSHRVYGQSVRPVRVLE